MLFILESSIIFSLSHYHVTCDCNMCDITSYSLPKSKIKKSKNENQKENRKE